MASLLGDDNVIQYMKGDYAFFELSNKEPYVIRRIDEIFRTEENLIEVRCTKVYRIKDLSQSLQNIIEEKFKKRFLPLLSQERSGKFYDNDLAIAQIKEIFVSTECEQILLEKARGKCMAIVLSEAEDIYDYLHLPDVFFFYYTYDREAKVFGTDLKEPRIGIQYQAQNLPINEKKSDNNSKIIFNQIWRQNSIRDLDQLKDYLTIVRSVGILARSSDAVVQSKKISLDSIKSDSLRDTTIQTAFSILHSLNYDFWRATRYWVQGSSPVLIIDAKESWLNEEVTIFEEALEMHGKKFHYISKNILKWRSIKSIIDFYYMWKTTGRYLAQRLKSFHDPSSLKTKELKSCKVRKSTEKHSMRFDSGSSALYSTQAQVSSTAHSAGAESTRFMTCDSCKQRKPVDNFYFVSTAQMQTVCTNCWVFWKRVGIYCNSILTEERGPNDRIAKNELNDADSQNNTTKNAINCPKMYKCFFTHCKRVIFHRRFKQHLSTVHSRDFKTLSEVLNKDDEFLFAKSISFKPESIFMADYSIKKSIRKLYKNPFMILPNMQSYYDFHI